jgi:quercetin dioxygenase-like cupin family protein
VSPNDASAATFAAAEDGEPLWGLGGLLLFKLPAERAGGRLAILEERFVRGSATPPHVHPHDDETFIVLDGELSIWVEGQTTSATAGAVAHIPGGLVHAWRVESDEARTIVITTARHETFYREASQPAPAAVQPPQPGVVDPSALRASAERHGVRLLGPVWTGAEPEITETM